MTFEQVKPHNDACLKFGQYCYLNYEKKARHTVLIRSTDNGQPPLYNDFYIHINLTDVNDQPRNPQLSGNKIHENTKAGTPIGTFSAFDEDRDQNLTYSLVENGQGKFKVVGTQLQVAQPVDYEEGTSHKITLLVEDDGVPAMSVRWSVNPPMIKKK